VRLVFFAAVFLSTRSFHAVRSARQDVAIRLGEPDVRGAHAAPSAVHGQEYVRRVGDELGLDFRRQHQVSEAFFHGRERGEDVAADTEVDRAHVRAFFRAVEAEGDASKIGSRHLSVVATRSM